MKKIGNTASSVGFDTEAILCSSDPSSLDGVIIKNGGKKVAVLDGTAPHIRDAELPGVTDSLIDLGKCWDEKTLALHKDEIISINQKKSGYYSDAYSYLSVMREIDTKIKAELRKNYNFKKGKNGNANISSFIHNKIKFFISPSHNIDHQKRHQPCKIAKKVYRCPNHTAHKPQNEGDKKSYPKIWLVLFHMKVFHF